jgi:hypothetical protein
MPTYSLPGGDVGYPATSSVPFGGAGSNGGPGRHSSLTTCTAPGTAAPSLRPARLNSDLQGHTTPAPWRPIRVGNMVHSRAQKCRLSSIHNRLTGQPTFSGYQPPVAVDCARRARHIPALPGRRITTQSSRPLNPRHRAHQRCRSVHIHISVDVRYRARVMASGSPALRPGRVCLPHRTGSLLPLAIALDKTFNTVQV